MSLITCSQVRSAPRGPLVTVTPRQAPPRVRPGHMQGHRGGSRACHPSGATTPGLVSAPPRRPGGAGRRLGVRDHEVDLPVGEVIGLEIDGRGAAGSRCQVLEQLDSRARGGAQRGDPEPSAEHVVQPAPDRSSRALPPLGVPAHPDSNAGSPPYRPPRSPCGRYRGRGRSWRPATWGPPSRQDTRELEKVPVRRRWTHQRRSWIRAAYPCAPRATGRRSP